jgi:ubiquinone/menaquinone biosynthesis C-methylase UbiE
MVEIERCDYDKIAKSYDDVRGTSKDYIMYWTSQLAHYGMLQDSDNVLDIGCGTGRYTEAFASSGTRMVVGLDLSRQMLMRAYNKFSSNAVLWLQANCEQLPFQPNIFNVAYMILVAHHIPLEERKAVYQEVYNVLMSSGRFVIMTRSHDQIRDSLISLFPEIVEIDTARMPDIIKLETDLKAAGFSTVNIDELPNYTLYRDREAFIEKVENKFISTLTMFDELEFQAHMKTFKKRLDDRFGSSKKLYDPMGFTFVTAVK